MRPVVGRPDRQEAALALDHHGAGVERGRPDQRDAPRPTSLDLRADIFGAGAGLAEAAPGEQQPDPPIAGRWDLPLMAWPGFPQGPKPPSLLLPPGLEQLLDQL